MHSIIVQLQQRPFIFQYCGSGDGRNRPRKSSRRRPGEFNSPATNLVSVCRHTQTHNVVIVRWRSMWNEPNRVGGEHKLYYKIHFSHFPWRVFSVFIFHPSMDVASCRASLARARAINLDLKLNYKFFPLFFHAALVSVALRWMGRGETPPSCMRLYKIVVKWQFLCVCASDAGVITLWPMVVVACSHQPQSQQ